MKKVIESLFENFNLLNQSLDNQILEISVKQHQINIIIKDPLFYFSTIKNVEKFVFNPRNSYITIHQDHIIISITDLSTENIDVGNLLYPFLLIIEEFAEKICTCPSLEYVMSKQYIKCFLDKPGLKIEDLQKYEEILQTNGLAELEMHPQRPYLLFINEKYEV